MSLYIFAAPILSFLGLKRAGDRIRNHSFRQRFDSLYAGIDYYKESSAVLYTTQFMARRIVYAGVLCFAKYTIVLQIMIL